MAVNDRMMKQTKKCMIMQTFLTKNSCLNNERRGFFCGLGEKNERKRGRKDGVMESHNEIL